MGQQIRGLIELKCGMGSCTYSYCITICSGVSVVEALPFVCKKNKKIKIPLIIAIKTEKHEINKDNGRLEYSCNWAVTLKSLSCCMKHLTGLATQKTNLTNTKQK